MLKPLVIDNNFTNYLISSKGKIYNIATRHFLEGYILNTGYKCVYLRVGKIKKTYAVHRLVAITFLDNPENKKVVNHKDGNKLNNCMENLEWVSYQENTKHMIANNLRNKYSTHNKREDIELSAVEWKRYQNTNYFVSKDGRVYNAKTKVMLSPSLTESGYMRCSLSIDGKVVHKLIHRLVAECWIDKIEDGKIVNHIDGNKSNNTIKNLEIISVKENSLHSCYALRHNIKPVIRYNDFEECVYPSMVTVAKENQISASSIYYCIKNRTKNRYGYYWKYK